MVAAMRPRPAAQAYLRLRTLPAEQGQVDWGSFGHVVVGRARRPLMAFVMVLSYSRRIFLRFFFGARMDSLLRGHAEAFAAYGGCPRILLYDNLKSAVLERVGDAIRLHPTVLAFAGHYRFEPRPVAIARGNGKGRVERAIGYVRTSFFAAREFTDLADLNEQARRWCDGAACEGPWPEDHRMTVGAAFEAERAQLLPLPSHAWMQGERVACAVGKTPYVRFDLNDYSVPHTHVQRTLAVLADEEHVRIFDSPAELACHVRCWDRGQQIEDPAHVQDLVAHKRHARHNRGYDQRAQAALASSQLLQMAAARGHNLGAITAALLRLLQRYGAQPLQDAILDAINHGVPHPNAVSLALERAREAAGLPPPVPPILPEHVARRDLPVRPHPLESYNRHGRRPEHPSQDQADD
jgi:hypothetical protein